MQKSIPVTGMLVMALLLGAISISGAADRSVEARLDAMNRRAMESYDLLEFNDAKKVLLEALDLAKKNQIEGESLAKIHVNLGIVYAAGLKDRERAIGQFVKALGADSGISIDPALATPDLQELFDEARDRTGTSRPRPSIERQRIPAAGGGSQMDLESNDARGILHRVIEEAPRGRSVVVRTLLGQDLQTGKPFLHYRVAGQEEFETLPMSRRGGESYTATIPARAMNGRTLHYYIEVEDARGRSLATNGTPSSPNIVAIVEGSEEGESTDPVVVEEGYDDEIAPRRSKINRKKRLYLAAGIGSGIGWASGTTECTNVTLKPAGMAPAKLFHVTPEVGYFFTDQFSVSLQSRIQGFLGANPPTGSGTCEAPAEGAFAAVLRARYLFGRDAFRFFVGVAAGGGDIRHTVAIGSGANASQTDTVAGGYILGGFNFGFEWDFTNSLGMYLEVQTLMGFPRFTANVDGTLGFLVRL